MHRMRPMAMIVLLLLFLLFGWVIIASEPEERINRACAPVLWGGNVVTSITSMFSESAAYRVEDAVLDVHYGCRYTVWRLFYAEDEQN